MALTTSDRGAEDMEREKISHYAKMQEQRPNMEFFPLVIERNTMTMGPATEKLMLRLELASSSSGYSFLPRALLRAAFIFAACRANVVHVHAAVDRNTQAAYSSALKRAAFGSSRSSKAG